MANDLTLGLGVTIDDIQGLSKFEALGKTLKKTVQKAAEEGLLEGLKPGLDLIRNALQKNIKADQKDFLTDLYKYGASKYKEREKRENALRQHQAKLDMTSAAQMQRAANYRALRREEKKANVNSAIAEFSSSVPDAYSATSLMLQDVGVLTSRSNREAVGRDSALSYTDQKFYLGELKRKQAAQMRARLPWNETGVEAQDKAARAIYEAQHGAVSDRAWRVISAQEAFGGSALHSAWLSGASGSWERTEERKRGAELAVMRSDAIAAFEEDAAQQAAQAAEDAARQKRLISRTELEAQDRMARAKYEARYGAVSDRAWRVMSAQSAFGGDAVHSSWLKGGEDSWERTEEAKRRAELKGMRSDSAAVFGSMVTEADEAAESLARLGKAAQIGNLILSGTSALIVSSQHTAYSQMASRNISESRMLGYQLSESQGQILGGFAGGLAGLLAGGGFLGAALGATALGGLGGLWGNYKQKELEAVLKTVATTTAARRDHLVFGGRSGFSLGQAMEDAGFGTASDLNNMRWTAQTLPGAMALGMAGEQDMLMLSLMPEYFAALMGGADAATLAQAYSTSVGRLPAQLQPLVSTMAPGGSQGMYANALDPQFGNMLRYSGEFSTRDRFFVGASEYTTAGSIKRANTNINLAYAGVGKDLSNAMLGLHGDYFDMNYMSPAAGWASSTVLSAHSSRTPGAAEGVFALYETSLKNAHMAENTIKELSKIAETGLNLTIRVEGLGDLTQNFPFAAMSNGQTVSFNIGGM